MTNEEIIRMARQSGLRVGTNISGVVLVGGDAQIGLVHITIEELERFARLVAAAEREACVQIINEHRIPVGNSAAGEMACEWTYSALKEIRDAIRARGEA